VALGARGEDLAAAWYHDHGYQVLARNWRCSAGELDVVARRGRTTVFCEVKTRSTAAFGSPAEAVTPAKQARIRRLATHWLRATGARSAVRFDVASVLEGELHVMEAAF
jgi:putative endonuclease